MHLRGTPGPAPRSPRSRDGRASSAAQRSRSPRRTETSHEAAAQAASPADSSGAAAFGAEVVPDAPSHFGRAPQPDSFADINERHDIKTGQVPFDQRKKTSAARGGDETDGGDEMGKGQGNHFSGLYDRDGNPLHIYGDGNPIHIFSSVRRCRILVAVLASFEFRTRPWLHVHISLEIGAARGRARLPQHNGPRRLGATTLA